MSYSPGGSVIARSYDPRRGTRRLAVGEIVVFEREPERIALLRLRLLRLPRPRAFCLSNARCWSARMARRLGGRRDRSARRAGGRAADRQLAWPDVHGLPLRVGCSLPRASHSRRNECSSDARIPSRRVTARTYSTAEAPASAAAVWVSRNGT